MVFKATLVVSLKKVLMSYPPVLFARQKCSQHCEKRPHCQSGRAVGGAGGAEGGARGCEAVQEQGGRQSQGAGGRAQEVKITAS